MQLEDSREKLVIQRNGKKEQEKMKHFQEDFLKAKNEVVQELKENGFTVVRQHTK